MCNKRFIHSDRKMNKSIERPTDGQTERKMDRLTYRKTSKWTYRQANGQTELTDERIER